MRYLHLAALAVALSVPNVCAETLYDEVTDNGFLDRAVFITDDQFALDKLMTIAQRFKADMSRTRSFAQLLLARNSFDIAWVRGKGATDINFEWWLHEYKERVRTPFPVARLIVAGENCFLQVRDKSGNVERQLCGGTDPTVLWVGQRFELVHVLARYADERTRDQYGPISIFAYLVSATGSAPSSPDPAVWLRLAKLFGTSALFIKVRPDLWFIEESFFPFLYPFRIPSAPPLKITDTGGWVSVCDGDRSGLQCVLSERARPTRYRKYDLQGRPRTGRR